MNRSFSVDLVLKRATGCHEQHNYVRTDDDRAGNLLCAGFVGEILGAMPEKLRLEAGRDKAPGFLPVVIQVWKDESMLWILEHKRGWGFHKGLMFEPLEELLGTIIDTSKMDPRENPEDVPVWFKLTPL